MPDLSGSPANSAETLRVRVGTFLFLAISIYYWIPFHSFVDLTKESLLEPGGDNSSRLNQIVALLLFAGASCYGVLHPMRRGLMQPRVLLAILLLWVLFACLVSAHPANGIKAIILTTMVAVNANVYLLLPANERHFAKMLAVSTLVMLAVAYYGVLFKPLLSIHQANEVLEPMHAGLWRGHFRHKNEAAVAMVLASFLGLYVLRRWSKLVGLTIVSLAFFFLIHTGGKTSTAMLPGILLLAWLFEHVRLLRIPIAIGGVALFNLFAVGSAVFRPLGEFVSSLGIDATFTNRADVWRFAFSVIAEQPFIGRGFKAFWQTEEVVFSGGGVETWAVRAAHAHNSYLETLLVIGIPGLILTLLWLVVLPLYHISRIPPARQHSDLTRLFLRIWLYSIYSASLEAFFFDGPNVLWFTLLFAICGLRLQSSAALATEPRPLAQRMVAHA
ncbi:O-antigen ligase [Ensifer adhaerens]|uniref:O-antigen ligase family protein n=1 Tax=Ensifer adhaerens TaxID=106592 RepID=UPI00399BED39